MEYSKTGRVYNLSVSCSQMSELLGLDVAGRGQHAGHWCVRAGGRGGAEDRRALNTAVVPHRGRHLAVCR